MTNFDFRFTCTTIDSAYGQIEDAVKGYINTLLSEIAPNTDSRHISSCKESAWNTLKPIIGTAFEEVRESNSDIRDAAESQISEKEKEIIDLGCEIDYLKGKIHELEQTINKINH